MLLETAELALSANPDRALMVVRGLDPNKARMCALAATREAKKKMPKLTGASSNRLVPIWGRGYFGVRWQDSYVWFQDHGVRAFTMNKLAGKTIPMWIDDPTGQERARNPKAKTRVTMAGKIQVLIFRRAARQGQRITKTRIDPVTKIQRIVSDVPASYPGAPGRINVREAGQPMTTPGRRGGAVARGNIGVRWRHPGISPRLFINNAITLSAQWHGILPVRIYICDERWRVAVRSA